VQPPDRVEPGPGLAALRAPGMLVLCAIALSFGLTNATYLSFAADWVVRAGEAGLGLRATAPAIFVAYGICGLVGLWTGKIEDRVGLVAVLRGIFLASMLSHGLLALLPGSAAAVLASAGLQGMCIMTISAVFSFWSARLFPALPTASFGATLLAFAGGAMAGPTLAGAAMDAAGAPAVFGAAATLSLLTALACRPAWVHENREVAEAAASDDGAEDAEAQPA
jgi:predicted MFS family arabinose efflux permease